MSDRKCSVLFVDDEANILQGLRRSLRGMREEWSMAFAEGGEQALRLLEERPFDVVVSDMRMPRMDGAQLLSLVQERHPSTIRIILSGYSEEESILRTVGPAHQYVAKPCEPAHLAQIIRRAVELRRVLNQENLRALLLAVKTLPTPPDLYLKLVEEMASPRSSTGSIADIIAQDVAMMAELLKITNSSFFAIAARVTSPLQAVRILGTETIRALVLNIGIFRQFQGDSAQAPLVEQLNRYSLAVAAHARDLARQAGLDGLRVEQSFCAGMLAHVGSLVLIDKEFRRFLTALARVGPECDLGTAQRQVLGASHAELGGYLLGLWGFPDPVVEAVTYQLQPDACASGADLPLAVLHTAMATGPGFPLLPAARQGDAIRADEACFSRIGCGGANKKS